MSREQEKKKEQITQRVYLFLNRKTISLNQIEWPYSPPEKATSVFSSPVGSCDTGLPLLDHCQPDDSLLTCSLRMSPTRMFTDNKSVASTLWTLSPAIYVVSVLWHYSSHCRVCHFHYPRPCLVWPLQMYWQSTKISAYHLSTQKTWIKNNINTCVII